MNRTIGEMIKIRINELGWSLQELADRMGYANRSTISRIEKGEIDVPQSKVPKFAKVMGTTVAFLMDWEQVQQKNSTLAEITVRMRTDKDFAALIDGINQLDSDQLASIKQFVDVVLKKG